MAPVPRWLSLGLLPLAVLLEAGAYYAVRSVLFLHLRAGGLEVSEISTVILLITVASLVGTVLAGALSVATGPWTAGAVGAGMLFFGGVFLGGMPPEQAFIGATAVGFGWGASRPALFGAAARAFPDFRTENARNAACFGIYGATNLSALASSAAAAWGETQGGAEAVFSGVLALALPAALLWVALGIAAYVSRDAKGEPAPSGGGDARYYAVGGAVLLGGFVWAFWQGHFDILFRLMPDGPGATETYTSLMRLNPIVVTLGCGLGLAVSLGLHFGKVRAPTLIVLGVGLILMSTGVVGLLGADSLDQGIVGPAVLLLAMGEAVAAPLLMSRMTGDLPERFSTLVVAGYYVLVTLPSLLLRALPNSEDMTRTFSVLGATSALAVGVLAMVAGVVLRRALHPDPEEPAEF